MPHHPVARPHLNQLSFDVDCPLLSILLGSAPRLHFIVAGFGGILLGLGAGDGGLRAIHLSSRTMVRENQFEVSLLDQAQARASYSPLLGAHSRTQ